MDVELPKYPTGYDETSRLTFGCYRYNGSSYQGVWFRNGTQTISQSFGIYEGRAVFYGKPSITGTISTICTDGTATISQGDLVYKPELKVYFPVLSFCLVCFILIMIYRIFLKRLLP